MIKTHPINLESLTTYQNEKMPCTYLFSSRTYQRKMNLPINVNSYNTYLCTSTNKTHHAMKKKRILFLFITMFASTLLYSQVVGVKTNIVMDAMKIINLGAEIGLSKKLCMKETERGASKPRRRLKSISILLVGMFHRQ